MSALKLKETPSQTAGPYVHIGLMPQACGVSTPPQLGGRILDDQIEVSGTVWDGDGVAVSDILIEFWQADAAGSFSTGGHANWQRIASDFDTGRWTIQTEKPGASDGAAPHLLLWIVARGINIGLQTRVYFADDDHAGDPVLGMITENRRDTLIAQQSATDPARYTFDIHLQGAQETVFFDV